VFAVCATIPGSSREANPAVAARSDLSKNSSHIRTVAANALNVSAASGSSAKAARDDDRRRSPRTGARDRRSPPGPRS